MKCGYMNNFIEFAVRMVQLHEENDYEQLDELLKEAEDFFLSRGEDEKTVDLYTVLHERIQGKGNIAKLFEYVERFISFYDITGIKVGKDHYYSSKALIEHLRSNNIEVLKQLEFAYEENQKTMNIVARIAIINNMAYTYFLLEDFDTAYSFSCNAEKLVLEYNLEATFGHYKSGILLAKLYIIKEELVLAKEYLDKLINFHEFKSSLFERIEYYGVYAEYEASIGMITESIEHYKVAISHAEEKHMYIELQSLYKNLIAILKGNKYEDEALVYQEKLYRLVSDIEEKNRNVVAKKPFIEEDIKNRFTIINKFPKFKKVKRKETRIDDLTECFNNDYMIEKINKMKLNSLKIKPVYFVHLKLDKLQPILDEHGQIYAEKMVYEFSKIIKRYFELQIIGRVRFNEFLVIDNSNNVEALLETIRKFKDAIDKEKVVLSRKTYPLKLIGVVCNAKELYQKNNLKTIDLDSLTAMLRGSLSKEVLMLEKYDF